MNKLLKIYLSTIFVFLSACNLMPTLPDPQKVQPNNGLWAIPLSLHSTILTRQLTSSSGLVFKYKKLDGSIKEHTTEIRFLHEPSFHYVELTPGRYTFISSSISDKDNWITENIYFEIKPGYVTVHPYIYEKKRYRTDGRHYTEAFHIYDFAGERAKEFVQVMESEKYINQWDIEWPN
jgi:hypothetical protein